MNRQKYPDHTLLIPIRASLAAELFPIFERPSPVLDTILWDGPASFSEYRDRLAEFEAETERGESFIYVICDPESGQVCGSTDIRIEDKQRPWLGEIGLAIHPDYQGRGIGTRVVNELTRFAFTDIGLKKLEAAVFTSNQVSKRMFEKCGWKLEGTLRATDMKHGRLVDEYIFGIIPADPRPATRDQRPATCDLRPATCDLRPATCDLRP